MFEELPAGQWQGSRSEFQKHTIGLLSQQVWCWGRDIIRPEGNWLIEVGFERIPPPQDRGECASAYTLSLPSGRTVSLRGFGTFYGNVACGGIFWPRFEFDPLFTTQGKLDCPPWTQADLPALDAPTEEQRHACQTLVLELIDWIYEYECHVIDNLGIQYRRATLRKWDNGSRPFTPAEEYASAWRGLSQSLSSCFQDEG